MWYRDTRYPQVFPCVDSWSMDHRILGHHKYSSNVYFRIIFFPLFMVIIFIISYSGNLFVVIFLYMCIVFISFYNVYIGKLTFN